MRILAHKHGLIYFFIRCGVAKRFNARVHPRKNIGIIGCALAGRVLTVCKAHIVAAFYPLNHIVLIFSKAALVACRPYNYARVYFIAFIGALHTL